MPGGAIYLRKTNLEKDFNKASNGKAMSPPMKIARNVLKELDKVAIILDVNDIKMSEELAKADRKLKRGGVAGLLQEAHEHIQTADVRKRDFDKKTRDLNGLSKRIIAATPKALKQENPQEYRALKVLSSDIDAFVAYCKYVLKDREGQIKNCGQVINKAETMKSVEAKAMLQLEKAVKRGKSAIQKIKATPTYDVWTKHFLYAGRDIKMALISLKKAQEKAAFGDLPPAKNYYGQIMDWDTQKKLSTIDDDATPEDILKRLKLYSALVKEMAHVFRIT